MPITFEQSKDAIAQLVKHFATNREAYRAPAYKEAHARQEFIDPFFVALGWDVHNTQRAAPDYREVVMEDTIEIAGQKKAPDYVFRVGKDRKFFVEAKKPGVDLKKDAANVPHSAPAYQLRRYAWTAKLPLSLLTDFEELAVYDCRARPAPTDKASTGRLHYYTFQEYPDRWQEIWEVFSRQAVLGGSFDQYAQASKGKRGTSTVDAEILKEIEGWRDALARNLALRNPRLSIDDLNDAVQRTIDRIIFLRMAEDRGIEEYERLKRLADGDNIYSGLVTLFRHADARYNSGLFDFSKQGDTLTPGLKIDDKTLKPILTSLYFPESPYEFSVLPVEILGNVYEQFLGKVIRLTSGHQAKVEEKPEVRKAGGVHYTPAYIVEYIVISTMGKLIAGKSPQQLKGFRILDPACGSGSFLLGAYQFLLDYYLSWYIANDPDKHRKAVWRAGEVWRLTTAERKRILLEHIYGVDIDRQAVEVTKLSLLLKVLETETSESLGHQLTLLHEEAKERALPNLDRNIKCGNSLIESDYFSGQLLPDDAELKRVNPFDWAKEFPEAMRAGGFDCVIGNPPYRMLQPHNTEGQVLSHLRRKYLVADYKIEMFYMFLQLGVSVLRQHGLQGFIVPATILNNVYAETLRTWVMDNCAIRLISVADEKVFAGVDVHTLVLILQREDDVEVRKNTQLLTTTRLNRGSALTSHVYSTTKQSHFSELPGTVWNVLITEQNARLILGLTKNFPSLSDVATINRGLITGDRDKYFSEKKLSNDYVPIITGSDVARYVAKPPSEYVLFKKPKGSGGSWDSEVHLAPHKVVVRQIGVRPMASLIQEPIAVTGNLFTIRAKSLADELYILGIFNSKLIEFFWKVMFSDFKNSFPQVTIFSLSQIPICPIHFSDHADKARHDRMIKLVEQMLDLHKRLAASQNAGERERLQRLIDSTDQQIDALVYELYGLTPEEIAIVEHKAGQGA